MAERDDDLITEKEAARMRNQSVRTLQAERRQKHRRQGARCPYVKLGRTVRYRRGDVLAYIAAQTVVPVGETGE